MHCQYIELCSVVTHSSSFSLSDVTLLSSLPSTDDVRHGQRHSAINLGALADNLLAACHNVSLRLKEFSRLEVIELHCIAYCALLCDVMNVWMAQR